MSIAAYDLRCESLKDPLGCDFTAPRFSWKISGDKDARGVRQAAYRVQAGTLPGLADLWDSDKVDSDQSVFVPWGGPKLSSRQKVWWRVKVWDEDSKASKWSDDACLELGLLRPSDWRGAKWIGGPLVGGPRTTVPLPRLTRGFTLTKPVSGARLYITALGVYEAQLNGEKVGDAELSPGWTSYFSRVRYQTRDVGKLLREGDNALSVDLGDGWAVGHIGWRDRGTYTERPKLLALLLISHPDGSETVIRTDNKWQVAYGPRLAADLQMGEHHDYRLPWVSLGAASVFPTPEGLSVDAQNGPEIIKTQELRPVRAPYRQGGSWIFDLGINMVGRIRLKATGEAGTNIKIRYAEVLEKGPLATDGPIYTTNLRAAANTDYFTLKGDESGEVFEPTFTFHGFRYVEVTGYPGEPDESVLTGIVLHTECPPTGDFECSEPLVNQLQKNIDWGWRGNSLDVPTDCPQRDERLGWTGDAQVFCRTACFIRNTASFWHKWMGDMRDAQGPKGELPPFAPLINIGNNALIHSDGGPAWADAGVVVPWTVYLAYGDTRILSDNYDLMKRFVEFWMATAKDSIRCYPGYEKEGWVGFGDWLFRQDRWWHPERPDRHGLFSLFRPASLESRRGARQENRRSEVSERL
jgi:alpha-L-rhamnosidase